MRRTCWYFGSEVFNSVCPFKETEEANVMESYKVLVLINIVICLGYEFIEPHSKTDIDSRSPIHRQRRSLHTQNIAKSLPKDTDTRSEFGTDAQNFEIWKKCRPLPHGLTDIAKTVSHVGILEKILNKNIKMEHREAGNNFSEKDSNVNKQIGNEYNPWRSTSPHNSWRKLRKYQNYWEKSQAKADARQPEHKFVLHAGQHSGHYSGLHTVSTTETAVKYKKSKEPHNVAKACKTLRYQKARRSVPSNFRFTLTMKFKRQCFSLIHKWNTNCSCNTNSCHCSQYEYTSVLNSLPANISELAINLCNITTLQEHAFSRYGSLKYLDLSCNKISSLNSGVFNGLPLLISLNLSNNFIMSTSAVLADDVFKPLTSLKVLWMEGNGERLRVNELMQYPDTPLASLTSLEELYLDVLTRQKFGPGFKNMTSLRSLTLGCSEYHSSLALSVESFENVNQITFLNMSYCLSYSGHIEFGAFSSLNNLLLLDISRNRLLQDVTNVTLDLRYSNIETLIMDSVTDGYSAAQIMTYMYAFFPKRLRTLVARNNGLLFMAPEVRDKLTNGLQIFSNNTVVITANDYFTLETLADFKIVFSSYDVCIDDDLDIHSQLGVIKSQSENGNNYHMLKTLFLNERKLNPRNIKRIRTNAQNLQIEELDLSCCQNPDFYFSRLENFTNLSILKLNRASVFRIIPSKTALYSIKHLELQTNYLDVYINNNNSPLSFLPNLSYLDLSLNHLSYAREDLFQELHFLEQVRLDRNPFSQFDVDISNMTNLRLLNLSHTALPNLRIKTRSQIDTLCSTKNCHLKVDMTGCPIQCDCDNLDFLKWMVNSGAFDKNFTGYMCRYPNTFYAYITDGYRVMIRTLEKECAENYPLFLVVIGATMILTFATLGSIIYRLRWKLRYLYYAAYLKFMDKHKPAQDKEFEHDVFLCYDSDDGLFVITLSRELENRGLKLLIHSRDFVAGDYIASNIVKAVTGSRKTLVVLTRKLLASTWCNYEIQMATMESVQTGRQVLVFLLKENIPNKELGVELLRYIRSNTYLPYPSQEEEGNDEIMERFYDKLSHDLKS